jgi:hypothetical protein
MRSTGAAITTRSAVRTGLSSGFRDGVAPRLSAQREACFRPAGPERDALGCAAGAGSLGDGAAEQTGGEDREVGKDRHG